jgi:hypothetical protein
VKQVTNLGTLPFNKIFQHLPDGCRYAIVSHYDLRSQASRFALLDLWASLENKTTGEIIPPKAMLITDCIDVALMHATLNYGA